MGAHGFFRNMELMPVEQTNDTIIFKITQNEQTFKIYPYHFEFEVKYQLTENKLNVEFSVKNTGKNEMFFMLGGHPGFKVAKNDLEKYEDYYLKFEKKETARAMQVVDGFLANEFVSYLKDEDTINLKHELFIPDAIVLQQLKSNYVDLLSRKNDSCIRFYFSDFETLAIWSLNDEKANYVCLEPWNGIQKDFVLQHEKMGVLSLKENCQNKYSYTIEIIK